MTLNRALLPALRVESLLLLMSSVALSSPAPSRHTFRGCCHCSYLPCFQSRRACRLRIMNTRTSSPGSLVPFSPDRPAAASSSVGRPFRTKVISAVELDLPAAPSSCSRSFVPRAAYRTFLLQYVAPSQSVGFDRRAFLLASVVPSFLNQSRLPSELELLPPHLAQSRLLYQTIAASHKTQYALRERVPLHFKDVLAAY